MTVNEDPAVMGPGGLDTPGDNLDAPLLTSKTEKMDYRENVRMWYDCVQAAAKSGYTKAKATAGNLGYSLFTKMEPRFKQTIKSAVKSRTLRLRSHSDGTKFTDQEHIQCVEKMLELVAKESATDRVRRVIHLSKEIYACKRKEGETYREFGDRFEGVARTYLSYAGVNENSQDEEYVALILIENAKLPTSTYNNILNNLINRARMNPVVQRISVDTKELKQMMEEHKALQAKFDSLPSSKGTTQVTDTAMQELRQSRTSLVSKIAGMVSSKDENVDESTRNFTVTLAQAIEELQEFQTKEQRSSQGGGDTILDDDDETIDDKITRDKGISKKIGSMMGGNSRSDGNNRSGKGNIFKPNRRFNNRDRRRGGKRHQSYRKPNRDRYRDHESGGQEYSNYNDQDAYDRQRDNVHDRLGDKPDNGKDRTIRVRFNSPRRDSPRPNDQHSEDEHESQTDLYFRKRDRQRS